MHALLPSEEVAASKQQAALTEHLFPPHHHFHIHTAPSRAAILDAFCEPIESKFMTTCKTADVEPMLWHTWEAILVNAAAIPHADAEKRRKLVDLLCEMAGRPTLMKGDAVCEVEGAGRVWKDLPIFGWQAREAWNFAASEQCDPEWQSRWVNLNAWTATLVATLAGKKQSSPDLSLFGIWTIRMALEEEGQPSGVAASAAAVWIMYAAEALSGLCKAGKMFDGKVAKPGAVFKEKEWRGYAKDRWSVWMQRLGEIEGSLENEETKTLVKEARETGEKV